MRLAIAGDHHGVAYKAELLRVLAGEEHQVLDLGPATTEPSDYPDAAGAVGLAVRDGRADLGVLICGSGAGVAIAANKIRGVRAALCHDLFTARQSREDDDANVICIGSRVVSREEAVELVRTFVGARFSGADRHIRRLRKVLALEAEMAGPIGPTTEARPSGPPLATALARLERDAVAARIWKKDASLWVRTEVARAAIVNRLGWLEAPAAMRGRPRQPVLLPAR